MMQVAVDKMADERLHSGSVFDFAIEDCIFLLFLRIKFFLENIRIQAFNNNMWLNSHSK